MFSVNKSNHWWDIKFNNNKFIIFNFNSIRWIRLSKINFQKVANLNSDLDFLIAFSTTTIESSSTIRNISTFFYEYGGDLDVTIALGDDIYYAVSPLGVNIRYFDQNFSKMYISSNGAITFLSGTTLTNPTPIPIFPFIAPFWCDINPLINGKIFYRESSRTVDLNQEKAEIMTSFRNSSDFNPTRIFIITYDQVSAYLGTTSVHNTFQTAIATNGTLSFLIFNYNNLMWPLTNPSACLFGFNAGDGYRSYTNPLSFTDIKGIAATSNVNFKGKWIFAA